VSCPFLLYVPKKYPELRFQVDAPAKSGIQSNFKFLHLLTQSVQLPLELLDVLFDPCGRTCDKLLHLGERKCEERVTNFVSAE
jgi:hypothetical protein